MSGRIDNERSLRSRLEQQDRRLARSEREDVIVDLERRLLVRSPNGTFWSITVDDLGAISATSMGAAL